MPKMMGDFEMPVAAINKEGGLSSEARVVRCERLIAGGMDDDDAAFRCGFKNKESYLAKKSQVKAKTCEPARPRRRKTEKIIKESGDPDAPNEAPNVESPADESSVNEPSKDGGADTNLDGVALKIGRVDGTFMQYERADGGIRVVDQLGTLGMPHDATVWRALLREMDMALTMLGK